MAVRKRPHGLPDRAAVTELTLYTDIRRSAFLQKEAMINAIAKHACKGNWSKGKAIKGFMHVADHAAREYAKEGGGTPAMFTRSTRTEVATRLADELRVNINACTSNRDSACKELPHKARELFLAHGKCVIKENMKHLSGAKRRRR